MSSSWVSPESVRDAIAPFGPMRSQPVSNWSGDVALHPALVSFYVEVGPYGQEGPRGPSGLTIPTLGNPFWVPPLCRLWELQAGYRWNTRSGERITDWQEEWLVVADQGGAPFIFDQISGSILHDQHGGGVWTPTLMFADIFIMALALATIGLVHEEAGEDIYDVNYEVRPVWRTKLRARLTPLLGAAESDAMVTRLDW